MASQELAQIVSESLPLRCSLEGGTYRILAARGSPGNWMMTAAHPLQLFLTLCVF